MTNSGKALLNPATLEITQRLQTHCPRDLSPEVLEAWNGLSGKLIAHALREFLEKKSGLPFIPRGNEAISPNSEVFVAKQRFVRTSDVNPEVMIRGFQGNFQLYMLPKVEPAFTGSTILRYGDMNGDVPDEVVLRVLGGEEGAETSLTEIFALVKNQRVGGPGTLQTDGRGNLFFVKNNLDKLSRILVSWHRRSGRRASANYPGWEFDGYGMGRLRPQGIWPDGTRVFWRP